MGSLLSVALTVTGAVAFFVLLVFLRLRKTMAVEKNEQKRLNISTKVELDKHYEKLGHAVRSNPYGQIPAFQLAKMIRTRETTSQRVVEEFIKHIETVNPTLNAVVADRFKEAREEAIRADERIEEAIENNQVDSLPPLLGVPCTIKECFKLTGMPHTSGLLERAKKNVKGETDATAVKRLRDAGAIPLGVTNVSELCMWMESHNPVYGRTRNPYNPQRIVGGSSGGEGAIIGSGASVFGLGSDVGGSIRMPAFFNGVFGHKPSSGVVPATGQHPVAHNEAQYYLSTGPLCRYASDLMPLLHILSGNDHHDEASKTVDALYPETAAILGHPEDVDVSKLKVYWIDSNDAPFVSKVRPDLKDTIRLAAEHLASIGCEVEKLDRNTSVLKNINKSLDIWSCSMNIAAEGHSFASLLGEGTEISALKEIFKWTLGMSDYTIPALGLAITEGLPKLNKKARQRSYEQGVKMREEIQQFLGSNSVILYPPYPKAAPLHSHPFLYGTFDWIYTAIWNVMGFPSTQVPCGLNKSGLPLGLQVVGSHLNDRTTIAVAIELEKRFGGWKPFDEKQ